MEQVALYATWQARSLKYNSILNYLSGLNYFFKLHDFPVIDYDNFILSSTLIGIKRVKGDSPRQALPLLPNMLLKFVSNLRASPGHTAWRAAVLCSFRGLLRKSHVTDSEVTLLRKDFACYDWGVIISITHSKTIQFSQLILQIPIARCEDKRLCAVAWLEQHFLQVPADPEDMAFQIPAPGGGSVPFPYGNFQETLKILSFLSLEFLTLMLAYLWIIYL